MCLIACASRPAMPQCMDLPSNETHAHSWPQIHPSHTNIRACPAQICWLLLAIKQDQPKNLYVAALRDRCERAALEGSWVCSHALSDPRPGLGQQHGVRAARGGARQPQQSCTGPVEASEPHAPAHYLKRMAG